MEFIPRPYQRECIDTITEQPPGSYLVQMATGLGKTAVFTHIPHEGRMLILSHREELVRQPLKWFSCSTGIEQGRSRSNHTEEVVSACTASLVYKKCHKLKGAVLGLVAGSVTMIVAMLLWNWLITPLYMGVPREQVEALLLPAFLPFNALKAGLNSALILGLYKPLTSALRRARLLPSAPESKSRRPGLYLCALALLATCVLFLLVLKGIL